jgi:hypothetical protein
VLASSNLGYARFIENLVEPPPSERDRAQQDGSRFGLDATIGNIAPIGNQDLASVASTITASISDADTPPSVRPQPCAPERGRTRVHAFYLSEDICRAR